MQNQGDDDSGSAPSDAEVAFPMCWLCEKSDAGVTKRGLKGLKFHGKCLNAVLARYCQFRNGGSSSKNAKKAREADQKEMLDSAATWRPKVLPMLSADRETKSKARREARALTVFSEDLQLDGVYAMEDDCLKTFRGHQRFRAEESDVESEQAQAEFEAILAEQGDRWTHANGKQRIRVADPNAGKVRSVIGHETRGGQREPAPSPRRGASPDASLLPTVASSSQSESEGRSAASCARTSTAAGSVSSVQPRPTAPAGPAANLVPSPRWAAASALPKPPAASSSTPQSSAPSEAAKAMSPKDKEEDLDSADRSDSEELPRWNSTPSSSTPRADQDQHGDREEEEQQQRTDEEEQQQEEEAVQEQTTASSLQVGERGRP